MSKEGGDSSRRDEINAFAAMATGGLDQATSTSSAIGDSSNSSSSNNTGTFDFSAAIRMDSNRNSSPEITAGSFPNRNDDDDDNGADGNSERMSFAQAGQAIDNSGTFSRLPLANNNNRTFRSQSSGSSSAQHRNQNLEAAALALADPDSSDNDTTTMAASSSLSSSSVSQEASSGISSLHSSGRSNKYRHNNNNNNNNNSVNDGQQFLQFPCGAAMSNASSASSNVRNRGAVFRLFGSDAQGGNASSSTTSNNNDNTSNNNDNTSNNNNNNNNIHPHFGQIPPNKTPMHAQKVLLQRPLFFGHYLPPRVIEEATKIVDEALQDQWKKYHEGELSSSNDEDDDDDDDGQEFIPRIGQLPPGVRNLVSAIRCYGFGWDVVGNRSDSSNSTSSSPYVSVFCPRWSEDRKKSYSPDTATAKTPNTSTAANGSVSAEDASQSESDGDSDNTEENANTTASAISNSAMASSLVGGQQAKEIVSEAVDTNSLSERDMFSAFARHGSDYSADGDASSESSDGSRVVKNSAKSSSDSQISEQALFTQWVHEGKSPVSGNASSNAKSKSSGGTFNFKDSFRTMNTMVPAGGDDSDDDTVVGSEMKTKVGVNEHLNAALASLEDGQSPAEAIESAAAVEEGIGELTQVPLTEDGGRPLSNQELMNAHAPLFGIDDPPLPSESDLGNHETREEQQKSKEQRRIQAFIEKFCPHNIFGPLACPNPSAGPDDNHSWNSLAIPLQRNPTSPPSSGHPSSTTNSPMARSVSSDSLGSLHTGYAMTAKKISKLATTPKGYDPRTRYGWWNAPNEIDVDSAAVSRASNALPADLDENSVLVDDTNKSEAPIQLPPVEHPSNGYRIQTLLEPSPEKLHEQNRPLSELHPATSLAQALPFVSDRPPSYRYLQVNTQAVAFPALAEEVEPLFCSLAIYHVETIAHNLGDRGMAPIPDLERCGKVTETLNFDLIKNAQVEKQCYSSLSPYTPSDDTANHTHSNLTSCGVFPLPSNLSVNNLYAIITVGKVISEGSDFEPYLRAKPKGKDDQISIENLRAKAEKASTNHGNFVMPFAFGVAPLLQVFGADVPRVPSSRAVQIPLFRFYAGNGDRQIIDHIMVMLYPRADHRASGIGGPAPLTNGGTAMLVMRNFGYLGLHEVVNGKSSLAMDRLIDFTGEMQLRRRDEETSNRSNQNGKVASWRSQYEAEPTINGGRCTKPNSSERSYSTLNAQELAPVPLLASPHSQISPKSRARGHSNGDDVEPFFHTTFCNELLCYPRVLRNCHKGNIVVKVEMREIEWKSEHGVFLAHIPSFGPAVHNLRRGPFLVQEAYTSCSARRSDPRFLDEFKLKLPLMLGNTESRCLSIFFTVYRLSFSSRKKWGLRGLGKKKTSKKFDEITGEMVGESDVVTGKDCQLIQLGSGFLPLEKKNSNSMLENGSHDVKISYIAKYPVQKFCDKELIRSDTIVMSDFSFGRGDSVAGDESGNDDGESQDSDRYFADTLSATSASDRDTVLSENMEDSRLRQFRKQLGMLLQVRISVQSSIHSQNATLNEFLSQEPDLSIPLKAGGKEIISFLRSGKDAILRQLNVSPFPPLSSENIQYETKKLLMSTVDLARPEMCPVSDITLHLMRVCKQLWKVTVVGTGNHDLKWANPAATLPLRVNAFATLLQVLGSSTLFLSKRGVNQLDGKGKFGLLSLSRVMGLLFDEKEMFGDSHCEVLSNDFLSLLSRDRRAGRAAGKKGSRGHVRSSLEFSRGSDGVGAIVTENNSKSSETPTNLTNVSTLEGSPRSERTPDKVLLTDLESRKKLLNESDAPKIDTMYDFKNAMQTGIRDKDYEEDIIHEGQYSGNEAAASWIVAFGGSSGNRRFMTAPTLGLSTIQEDTNSDEEQKLIGRQSPKAKDGPLDSLDAEMILPSNSAKKRPVTQFRIPKRSTKSSSTNDSQSLDIFDKSTKALATSDQSLDPSAGVTLLLIDSPERKIAGKQRRKKQSHTLPVTDADMLKAESFLDAIEKSLGLGASFSSNYHQEEEERVYGKHHRKTVSHSSIDWSIPNDDLSSLLARARHDKKQSIQPDKIEKMDESMTTLSQEINLSVKLPNYVDRLVALGASETQTGRWFPYTYEIIIMQWSAILKEQQRSSIDLHNAKGETLFELNDDVIEAASRTTGYIIACAPILFEVIKQSLGARVISFIDQVKKKSNDSFPPLVRLDDAMQANLEQLIMMITDLCLDSRNFDTYETRLSCVDINDSIVCFLRDMFSFLDPACVYRLTMLYLSRLTSRDGLNKDSKIGLDISHEIKKLQMSAISAFVRFPDFIKVNSPQMNSWTNLMPLSPDLSTVDFFDNVLASYEKLGLQSILSSSSNEQMELPRMRPHWMAETIVDICFSGIDHKEPNIQLRSSSLLLELFWSQGQRSVREGYSPIVASMYATFIEKALSRTSYLSCFSPKSQVRRDVVLCVVFVLQSTPAGLLRAIWRKLFRRSPGKGLHEKHGGISSSGSAGPLDDSNESEDQSNTSEIDGIEGPNIYDMFSLLNICLATAEYEGCDENAEMDGIGGDGPLGFWSKEFLMARERDTIDSARQKRMQFVVTTASEEVYATTSSRKWFSHDASMVLIRTAQQIVRELRFVLEPVEGSQSLFNPARRKAKANSFTSPRNNTSQVPVVDGLEFTYMDTIIFVRGATSVYLNSLVLRESDIAIVKTLNASVEIIKIFGIRIFNEAVGETLQHWLRMITFHCGSRRAEVRVPASDFAELILRSTWDCFGSFFRIRIPLLAVQTEVMQRIVATATSRYNRDQRKSGLMIDSFSNACAEASLTPLWRTTDRLHHQSASQNVAFRSSLVRLAEKIKKLHRAYIAAHALSFQNWQESQDDLPYNPARGPEMSNEMEFLKRANRISVIRVVNASAGYSKQFLGLQVGARANSSLAHREALEDAFLDAADVFSPTELPDQRVAWLRKLAQFHAKRSKHAEQATCHYMIYYTLNRSCRLNWTLWSSSPFLPWVDNLSDGPTGGADDMSFSLPLEKTNSTGRVFMRTNPGKTAFHGVSLTSEYFTVNPWISSREMESNMLEEAEAAGYLFQKSGIIASSRYMWGLAAQYYAQKFMYGKLTHVYERLARTVVSQVPNIDNTLEQAVNVGIPLGRFYRVWYHGGAPDELIGKDFVYRTRTKMSLTRFGKELRDVLRSIIPDKTPIHLVLDGRAEESVQVNPGGFMRMGGAPLQPVKVKVTPLRPVVRNESRIRGLPEWFKLYIDNVFSSRMNSGIAMIENNTRTRNGTSYRNNGSRPRMLHHSRSKSSMHSSGSLSQSAFPKDVGYSGNDHHRHQFESESEGELVGAEKFWYTQCMNKDRSRGSRDWLKGASNDFAEKTIRVTQLQVRQAFPACISRQTVIHRDVYTQSPLEAAVDNLCLWCAVLFRTFISSNGSTVLGVSNDPGIGIEAAKVVSECIHSSRVKEMGTVLLRKNTGVRQDDDDVLHIYDRLCEEEVQKFQLKLARSLIVFMELLHLLIARNRDLLLDVVQKRKKFGASKQPRDIPHSSMHKVSSRGDLSLSMSIPLSRTPSRGASRRGSEKPRRLSFPIDSTSSREDSSVKTKSSSDEHDPNTAAISRESTHDRSRTDPALRTDSAIGIQRELQLAYINIAKDLWPMIHGVMENDTPRWLKECCQDSYFSKYTYRRAKIPIGEELIFEDASVDGSRYNSIDTDRNQYAERYSMYTRSDKSYSTQAPDSPGSIGSIASRGSDAKSLTSIRSQKERYVP